MKKRGDRRIINFAAFVFLLISHIEKKDEKRGQVGNILPVFADEEINLKQR
jgi:hypothetical protein